MPIMTGWKCYQRIVTRIAPGSRLTCALLLLCASATYAEDYPSKPIAIVVGPGPDILARIVGQKLTEAWGQPVVVEPRPAAGGIVAADAVAKAQPNGYTMLLSTGSYTVNSVLRPKSPYDFQRDFTPVSLMATLPFLLVVNPTVPANNLKELIALARAKPGKLDYASSGIGTPAHLAGEMLKQMAKIDMVHVAYKGAAAGVTDVVSGQVQMMFVPAPAGLPLVKSGRLRALAVSSPKRYAELPEVPTVAEQGYPDFAVVGWNGLHMPAKTPPAIIEKVNREIVKIMHIPDVQQRAVAAGFEPVGSTIEDFDAFVRADIARAAAVIKASNMQPD
jgi:tripartite-type tricarboxylate transporter receptor subunit TctC